MSHVEEDAALVLDLAVRLEEAGYGTWCYEVDSVPGGSYLLQTARGIERARVVLVLISPASLEQVQVTKEIVRAHEANKPFLPVLDGLAHQVFQARAPEWRQAMGATVSIAADAEGIEGLFPRVVAALEALGVPRHPPAPQRIARLVRERDRRAQQVREVPSPPRVVHEPAIEPHARRSIDVALILLLLPVALFAFVAYGWQLVGGRLAWVGVYVRADATAGAPVVRGFWPGVHEPASGLQVDDVLVRLGDADLAGYGPIGLFLLAEEKSRSLAADASAGIPVTYRRGGTTGEASLPLVPVEYPWRLLPLGLALPLTGTLTLLRRPGNRLARLLFLSFTLFAIHWTWFFGGPQWLTAIWIAVFAVSSTFMFPVILRLAADTPDGVVPPAGVRWWSWLFALFGPVVLTAVFGMPLPPALGLPGMWVLNVLVIAALLGVLTLNYRRTTPIGRRQVKWVLVGLYIGLAPVLAADVIASAEPRWWWLHDVAAIFEIAIPIGFLIAFVRFNFLDVDRLISATIVNSGLTFSFFVLALVCVPRAANFTGMVLGLDPTLSSWVITGLLATPLYPAYTYLRPRVDRMLFVERYALEQSIEDLLDALEGPPDPDSLLRFAGQRLYDLLRPESCGLYALREGTFVRVLGLPGGGTRAPDTVGRDDEVLGVLARQAAIVDLQGRRASVAGTMVSAAERRTLAPFAAALVLCVRRGRELAAFVCLGRKRSGDVYTSTELGLLRTVLEKMGRELLRFDLGRHVPAQVVEFLVRDPKRLQPTSQEISVLHATIAVPVTTPADRAAHLRDEAVDEIAAVIARHEGLLDVAMGGQVRAIWNAPIRVGDHAARACRAAIAARETLAALEQRWAERHWPAVELRVGLSTGTAMVGNVPLGERVHYTAEGPCVDLAGRLGDLNGTYGTHVLVANEVRDALGEEFVVREIDLVSLDGDAAPIVVHELLGVRAADRDGRLRRLEDLFSRARAAYRAEDWQDAAARFEHILAQYPGDAPSSLYVRRARSRLESSPANGPAA